MSPKPKDPESRDHALLWALAVVGLEMAAPVGIGMYLDRLWSMAPWLCLTGAVLGLVGGMWHLIVTLQRAEKLEAKKKRGDS